MIVFVPNMNNPLVGTWCDLPRQQRVAPNAVRTIWHARTLTKQVEGGMPLAQARDAAAIETARMLGLTLRTVRAFCHLPHGPLNATRRVGRRVMVRRAKVTPENATWANVPTPMRVHIDSPEAGIVHEPFLRG